MVEFLFHNKGDGTFEEVGLEAEVAVDGEGRTYAGMGVDFADYDNDGWPDLIVDQSRQSKIRPLYKIWYGTFNYSSYTSGIGGMTLLHSGWGVALSRL